MNMRSLPIALILVACHHFTAVADALPKQSKVILSPAKSDAQWTPGEALVGRAEQAVLRHLQEIVRSGTKDKWHAEAIPKILQNYSRYRVQFIGRFHFRRNIIECNYFIPGPWDRDWTAKRVGVVDGGWAFWRIKYDVELERCFDLRINSRA